MERAVAQLAGGRHTAVRALLLGVTPDIACMRWPENSSLMAIERSDAMIEAVWPGNLDTRWAVRGDWLAPPLRGGTCDVVIGDGALNCLTYSEFRLLMGSVCRVLDRDGRFVLRCYVQPEDREGTEALVDGGQEIRSFHAFKLRLLMTLQPDVNRGIAVRDAYRFCASHRPDIERLAVRNGWDREVVEMLELYRVTDTIYTFPTLAELRSLLAEFFDIVSVAIPDYELGERCPLFTLRPRCGLSYRL